MPCFDIEGSEVDCNDESTLASGEMSYEAPDTTTSPSVDPALLDYYYGGGSDSSVDPSSVGHAANASIVGSGGSALNSAISALGNIGSSLVKTFSPTSQVKPIYPMRTSTVGGTNSMLWIVLGALALIAIVYYMRSAR
jgi:hypothetical protein